MRYFVHDDAKRVSFQFESKQDLAAYLLRNTDVIENMNVTGKDTCLVRERTGYVLSDRLPFRVPTYRTVRYLRRYRILDADGRHVDPRAWPKSDWCLPKPNRHSGWPWPDGSKPHWHRLSGPSFLARDRKAMSGLRAEFNYDALSDDEIERLAGIEVPRLKIRPKNREDATADYDWYDAKGARKYVQARDACWKNNRHASRQYMRHKPVRHTDIVRAVKHGDDEDTSNTDGMPDCA